MLQTRCCHCMPTSIIWHRLQTIKSIVNAMQMLHTWENRLWWSDPTLALLSNSHGTTALHVEIPCRLIKHQEPSGRLHSHRPQALVARAATPLPGR